MATLSDATGQFELLVGADLWAMLTPAERDWALARSASGASYDAFLAAAEAVVLLGGQGRLSRISRFTSEGATFEKAGGLDWRAFAAWLRSQSGTPGDDGYAFLVVS